MPRRILPPLAFLLLATSCLAARPQQDPKPASQQDAKKQSDGESSSLKPEDTSSSKPAQDGSGPNYDPYHAEQDVEVGTFYMHKGDVDAAIGRFEDAIHLRANFAKPRILLAEAYEKKGDKANELKYYKEYLQVFPDAPDAKKIRQKIAKLENR
jgi:tetratricopeptide (TPR) repeat protein